MGDPTKHAEFPPSSLEHYNNCPGFLQHEGDPYFSEKGTDLHRAWEIGIGEFEKESGRQLTRDEVRALDFVINHEPSHVGVVYRELRVDCAGITWGTNDFLVINPGYNNADILDAKFGRIGVLPAQINIQIWAYCLGVWTMFPEIDLIRVGVAVPYRDEYTSAKFYRHSHKSSFEAFINRVIEKVALFRAHGDVTMLNYNAKSCAFCARSNCPVKQKRLSEVLNQPLEFETNIPVKDLDAEEISQAKILSNQYKRWAATVDKRAMELSNAGQEIPGFDRCYRSGSREVSGEAIGAAYEKAAEIVDDPSDFFDFVYTACTLSVTDAVKWLRDESQRGTKKQNEESFLDALRDAGIGQPKAGYYYLKIKSEIYEESESES
jgi:Protein of unknown function (DUF2800)